MVVFMLSNQRLGLPVSRAPSRARVTLLEGRVFVVPGFQSRHCCGGHAVVRTDTTCPIHRHGHPVPPDPPIDPPVRLIDSAGNKGPLT
jgi:hypothetical protein